MPSAAALTWAFVVELAPAVARSGEYRQSYNDKKDYTSVRSFLLYTQDCMQEILTTTVDKENICAVIFLYREDKILLGCRQYSEGDRWTAPGGKCILGETIEHCVRRELLEETGISNCTIDAFLGTVPGGRDPNNILYVYSGVTNQEAILSEPDKFSEWKWCEKENIPENFINYPSLKLFLSKK